MNGASAYADWIAVDWGTSRLRVWAMAWGGQVVARAASDDGMGVLDRDGFEPALLRLIAPWLGQGAMPVLACGMVGARQGWAEMPYQPVPCAPGNLRPGPVATQDKRLRLFIMPGLSQAQPADIMRGEETQIAGFMARQPGFDGVLCLPGTHTKWVRISAGEVTSFQTFMTGEVFRLLSKGSVLRHSVAIAEVDQKGFLSMLSQTLSRPERLAQGLFSIRAQGVLNGMAPARARGQLSGVLIGAELAAAKPYWLGQRVVIIGAAALSVLYAGGLDSQGVTAERYDADPLTRAGLARACASVMERTP
ncbi:MAG: 2-dehydro-3-deoxygalactonokinase [Rhodobacteraceae bacterium]|nr:2-dehydro-3-deoxygalactonokinase [Paracoccaceae bacterium]